MPYIARKYKRVCSIIFFVLAAGLVVAQEKSEGVRLFEQNKINEAISVLEAGIAAGKALPVEYNYLGLAYYQAGNYEKSVEAFKKGLDVKGTSKKLLYFNMGNSYFALEEYEAALDAYSMAVVADPTYSSAVLNMANAKLKLDRLEEAAEGYERYLALEEHSPKREQIEKMVVEIRNEITLREENARIEAERAGREADEEAGVEAELVVIDDDLLKALLADEDTSSGTEGEEMADEEQEEVGAELVEVADDFFEEELAEAFGLTEAEAAELAEQNGGEEKLSAEEKKRLLLEKMADAFRELSEAMMMYFEQDGDVVNSDAQ